jgi:hypothetical protein
MEEAVFAPGGIYHLEGHTYIKVDDKVYLVEPDPTAWRIRHPISEKAFFPPLERTTKGWRLVHKRVVT